MDVTREVVTATPKSAEYKAPINQFGRIRTFVDPGIDPSHARTRRN
jgi:hypothetical protein